MVNFLVYNPHKNNITNQFKNICRTQDKINVIRNFNSKLKRKVLPSFYRSITNLCKSITNLQNFIKQSTGFEGLEKPTCIDLILTNCPCSFQNVDIFEKRLPDSHKITFTVLKQNFSKQKPRVVIH